MSLITITVQDTDDVTLTDGPILTPTTPKRDARAAIVRLAELLHGAASGIGISKVGVVTAVGPSSGTKASLTITIAAGNLSDGNTVTLGGTVLTAKAAIADPASNPLQFLIGAANTNTATALAAAMNLSPTISGLGVAVAASNVVTWTENFPAGSNGYGTATKSGANITLSAAALSGGVAPTFQGAAYYGLDNP